MGLRDSHDQVARHKNSLLEFGLDITEVIAVSLFVLWCCFGSSAPYENAWPSGAVATGRHLRCRRYPGHVRAGSQVAPQGSHHVSPHVGALLRRDTAAMIIAGWQMLSHSGA